MHYAWYMMVLNEDKKTVRLFNSATTSKDIVAKAISSLKNAIGYDYVFDIDDANNFLKILKECESIFKKEEGGKRESAKKTVREAVSSIKKASKKSEIQHLDAILELVKNGSKQYVDEHIDENFKYEFSGSDKELLNKVFSRIIEVEWYPSVSGDFDIDKFRYSFDSAAFLSGLNIKSPFVPFGEKYQPRYGTTLDKMLERRENIFKVMVKKYPEIESVASERMDLFTKTYL